MKPIPEALTLIAEELKQAHVRFILRQLGAPVSQDETDKIAAALREALRRYVENRPTAVRDDAFFEGEDRNIKDAAKDIVDLLVHALELERVMSISPLEWERADARIKCKHTVLRVSRELETLARSLRRAMHTELATRTEFLEQERDSQ